MATLGSHGARSRPQFFKVLLPPCLHKLRVPEEFARLLDAEDAGAGRRRTVLILSPLGRPWRAELRRDGAEAFLGGGWAEFAEAHGLAVGWVVVFRHEGNMVLTVKVFDTSCCLADFHLACEGARNNRLSIAARRPQFIKILLPEFWEKLRIPPKFVQQHISKKYSSSEMAIISSPLGKFWHVELCRDQSGVFLGSGWAQFLSAHDLPKGSLLLFRNEGNMLFTLKVFKLSGCQKEHTAAIASLNADDKDIRRLNPEQNVKQFGEPSRSRKRMRGSDDGGDDAHSEEESSKVFVTEATSDARTFSTGPEPWIKKSINAYALKYYLALSKTFCSSIGLPGTCTITVKTSMHGAKSWQIDCISYNTFHCLKSGWREFCKENKVKAGDCCTFKVVDKTLWLAVITSS